jgi:branched-chain amino acid transport system permease protein
MRMMLTSRRLLPVLVLLLAIFPWIPGVPAYWVTLANLIGIASLVSIGLVLLTGVGGMTSFGQAAFCGFGAYTTAVLSTHYGVSPWLTLPICLLVTGVLALPLGLLTVRLSGHFLPLGTIAWGLALYYLFGQLDFLGRYDGISSVPPLSLFGHPFYSDQDIFYVIWAFVLLAALAAGNLLDSRVGRAIRALRGGRAVAESFGADTVRAKLTVFVFAALLAGLSGWLYAHMQRTVNPSPFGLNMGIEYLLMAVVGGAGHVWGAVFGAGLVTLLKDMLQRVLPALFGGSGNYETIVFGAMMVLVLQFASQGLWPLITRLLSARTARAVPGVAAASALPRRKRRPPGEALMAVEAARKAFGGLVAVNDVSFAVRTGEIVGLIGPNGAGKSTTFNLISGATPLTAGSIMHDGVAMDALRPRVVARMGIARTFQHVKVLGDMSVLENVALGAHLRGSAGVARSILRLDRAEERRLLAEAALQIERVGLGELMHAPAGSLALGQLRILEVARALALDPALLLLDEPAAGLRHAEKQALAALLTRLRGDGMSILLVEHDMGFVMSLTDHIVVLDFGTKIAEGAPADIKAHPAVIEAYLGGAA